MAALRKIPVRIEGEYQPVSYVGHVRWQGMATADEPITALVLGRRSGGEDWARIGHKGMTSLHVELRVRPGQSELRNEVIVSVSMRPAGISEFSGSGGGVDFPAYLTSTAPFMFFLGHHTTGVPTWLAHVWSKAEDRVGAIFVVEADTRSARNGLWHLRDGVEGPNSALTAALTYGRRGTLER
jgi:hypothetical protein